MGYGGGGGGGYGGGSSSDGSGRQEYPSLNTSPAGSIRFNTDSSKMEIYNGDKWWNIDSTSPQEQTGGTRGIWAAGEGPSGGHTVVSYSNLSSTGNAATFGDLTQSGAAWACSSRTRGLCLMNNPDRKSVDKITIASLGDGVDWGDLVNAIWQRGTASDSTRGIWAGGLYPGSTAYDKIDAVTIATEGTAFEFGDILSSTTDHMGCASPVRAVFGGGWSSPAIFNEMDFITIQSTGHAANFGDLTSAKRTIGSCSNAIRGLWGGGTTPTVQDTIDYVELASLGNAVDFGNLIDARAGNGAASSPTRGVWAGGYDPNKSNIIDYVQIMTTGDAVDFGDLTTPTQYVGGFSNGHGGLG